MLQNEKQLEAYPYNQGRCERRHRTAPPAFRCLERTCSATIETVTSQAALLFEEHVPRAAGILKLMMVLNCFEARGVIMRWDGVRPGLLLPIIQSEASHSKACDTGKD